MPLQTTTTHRTLGGSDSGSAAPTPPPGWLLRVRLPRWCLPDAWPQAGSQPALADIRLAHGRIAGLAPHDPDTDTHTETIGAGSGEGFAPPVWDLAGALALPGLVDAHTHIDKAFTLPRMGTVQPGLLGAIDAMMVDRARWTEADVRERASRALQWAWEAGVTHLRSHCDWWEPEATPLAWAVLRELAHDWADRLTLERVSLMPLPLFAERARADALAATVARSGPGALLGGFVHSTHWDPVALRHLIEAAQRHGLDIDLHMDEELNPAACGLVTTAALLRELSFDGHVVCGHNCALAAQDDATALATLDAVARAPITLVTLPITNLLLQDAVTGRTPRLRGITRVKEARARGIPVLLASDNVQDPFCPIGSFDPLEAFATGVAAAQLDAPFDRWSEALCRPDWLRRGAAEPPLRPGSPANLLLFTGADAWGFPSRSQPRLVLRGGCVGHGQVPAHWQRPALAASGSVARRVAQ